MRCIVFIAALAYDFENAHLLRCVGLSKSTKMRQRMVGCVVLLFCGLVLWKLKRQANELSTILAFTFHLVQLDSHWILIGSCF